MSNKSDKKLTMQVRVDSGLHHLLKMKAAELGRSIRSLLEESLMELLAPKSAQQDVKH